MAECCHHDHGHDHHDDRPGEPPQDHASRSLAEALHVSFRLLSLLMILAAGAYLLTGIRSIEAGREGVVLVLGQRTGVVKSGLCYTWPFPVGEIQEVVVSPRTVKVDDFWMYETALEKTQELGKRNPQSEGLRPGWDGALLTGDQNLFHALLECTYGVSDVLLFAQNVPPVHVGIDRVTKEDVTVNPAEEMVRTAVCAAAIRAAAGHTAADLMGAGIHAFAEDVRRQGQKQLDAMQCGISLQRVSVKEKTWPLRVRAQYEAAQRAGGEAQQVENEARKDAAEILRSVAANYNKFVGEPWQMATTAPAPREGDYDLIGQYEQALRNKDANRAAQVKARIEELLLSKETGGKVSETIEQAGSYKVSREQEVMTRVNAFNSLLEKYREDPAFVMERLWAGVREEILNAPTVEKIYVTFGRDKTVLKLNRDPGITKEINKNKLKESPEGDK